MDIRYYYQKKNKFPHKIILWGQPAVQNREKILEWIIDNNGVYNEDYIYWGIKTKISYGYEIYFKDKIDAMAFKLRWI